MNFDDSFKFWLAKTLAEAVPGLVFIGIGIISLIIFLIYAKIKG